MGYFAPSSPSRKMNRCVSTVVWPEDRSRRTCGDLVHATLDERETKCRRRGERGVQHASISALLPPSGAAAVCGISALLLISIAAVCGISIAAVIGVYVATLDERETK